MRLAPFFLFVASLLGCSTGGTTTAEKPSATDTEKRLAELERQVADLQIRVRSTETQQIDAGAGDPLDLMALVDFAGDTVAGDWRREGASIFSPGTPDAKLAFPVRPSGDYRFTVKFQRHEGMGGPILCLPVADRHVNFALDAYNGKYSALEAVDGAYVDFPNNPTQIQGEHVVTDASHVLDATVRTKDGVATIRVDLDGKRLVEWTGKPEQLTLHPAWRLNDDRQLGLRSWQPFEFQSAELRMITGKANPIRAEAK